MLLLQDVPVVGRRVGGLGGTLPGIPPCLWGCGSRAGPRAGPEPPVQPLQGPREWKTLPVPGLCLPGHPHEAHSVGTLMSPSCPGPLGPCVPSTARAPGSPPFPRSDGDVPPSPQPS